MPTVQASEPTQRQSGERTAHRVSVDATSEMEAPFLSAQRGAGVPQNTAPGASGQELRKQRAGETGG